jgi:hypothetical protein
MDQKIRSQRLEMGDHSEMLLTDFAVHLDKNLGFYGNSSIRIPLRAITSIRVGWQRSGGLLFLGIIFFGLWGFLLFGETVWQQGHKFLSSYGMVGQYIFLVAALGVVALYFFYKPSHIQITAPTATIEGAPKSHEAARTFCDLVLWRIKEQNRDHVQLKEERSTGADQLEHEIAAPTNKPEEL